ncbi:MAG: laccase domain-containing protein [Phycisphaerae bacterium]|nr:laccase domain-containing protein [Phycisphaerae bacterium]
MPSEPSASFQRGELPDGREVYRFAPLGKIPGLAHAYTTRHGPLFPAEADAGEADGLVTDQPGLAVLGRSADCPLILAADAAGRAVGMAHASWRSTIKRVAVHLIEIMQKDFGVEPGNVIACVGPSAGPDHYEVGRDVYDAAVEHLGPEARNFFLRTSQPDKWLMDLWSANASQLMRAGVGFMNLYTARVCTIERNDLFPSVRMEGSGAQRFAAVVGLQKNET